jgi:hypothetical protein
MTSSSQVVTFRPRNMTCLRWAQDRYFLCGGGAEAPLLVSAKCAHRGGPLHLGQLDAGQTRIVCPMHFLATPVAALKRTAVPAIVRSDQVVAVLPIQESGADVLEVPPVNSARGA